MKKWILAILLILSIGTVSAGTYSIVTANYPILVNGQKVAVQPYNLNGTTLLPIRAVSDALGIPINWTGKAVEINTVDVEKLKEACVMIIASDNATYQQGSGVYVDYDQVLTAYHVVDEGRTQIRTAIDKADTSKMSVVSSCPAIDIATLKPTTEKKPTKIGDSDEVRVGDNIIVVACPDYKEDSTCSAKILKTGSEIVFSPAINGGGSGGALFNLNGELIGILVAADYGLNESYAVPINLIREKL